MGVSFFGDIQSMQHYTNEKMKVINIFISYRRNDTAGYSGRINDALSTDFEVFFDTKSIRIGDAFQEKINRALEKSDFVLLILGRDSCKEFKARISEIDYMIREISYAKKLNKIILPIIIDRAEVLSESCFPDEIKFLKKLNFYNIDHDKFNRDIRFIKKEIFDKYFNIKTPDKHIFEDEKNIFKKLELFLKASEWENANLETINLFLYKTEREKYKWFREKDAQLISCGFILFIDRLWKKYTEGKHGFSRQLNLLNQFGLSSSNPSDFIKFSEIMCWKNNKEWLFEGNYEVHGSYPTPVTFKKNISTNRLSFQYTIDSTKRCKEQHYG